MSYYHGADQQLIYGTRHDHHWFMEPIEPETTHGPRSQIAVASDSVVSVLYPSDGHLRRAVLKPASD